MADLKTKGNDDSVEAFLQAVADPGRREDCRTIAAMMRRATGAEARMWGSSIVGFGSYHYRYASGHEGDMCVLGFSPRKSALSLYLSCDLDAHRPLLARLGKHKTGKGCLYIGKLDDVDQDALAGLFDAAVAARKTQASGGG